MIRPTIDDLPSTSARWIVPERTEATLVDQLLKNRGVNDRERFFRPDYIRDSHDPYLFTGMELAVDRIVRAVERRQAVCVYADYDADGIPGGALLIKVLRANGATVTGYIPDRDREGYGLNESAVATLKQQGIELLITVDLGVTNHEAVRAAVASGIDVIVTDHHTIDPARIPNEAVAVIHPALSGSRFPFAGLAGGGVAWKLAQAIRQRTSQPTADELKWWIELPAISTVCDLVPLVDESRLIVQFGLQVLRKSRSVGLRALGQVARVDPATISERTIGFQLGPRLNAPGRIEHASPALELLLTDDTIRADELAHQLEARNQERRQLVDRVVVEAISKISSNGEELPAVIIVSDRSWPVGVLGLAASRLVERYYRPVILLNETADGRIKGSARSIEGLNVVEALTAQRDLLQSFGGHTGAAGLTLEHAALSDFIAAFGEFVGARLTPEMRQRSLKADAAIAPSELSDTFLDQLSAFAPYGVANATPRFVIGPVVVREVRRMGADGQHMKLTFSNAPFPALIWRADERSIAAPDVGETISLMGRPEWNEWNGSRVIQVILDDWRGEAGSDTVVP